MSNNSFDFHVYFHLDQGSQAATLDRIVKMLDQISQKETHMSAELDSLTAQVTASTTVQDSAMTLLQGLKTALDAAIAGGNPAALQALSDALGAESQKMADAITANTPAAVTPPGGGPGPVPASATRGR